MSQQEADAAPALDMVKLISAEGHEIYISRKCALVSGTIRAMLSGQFTESKGEITFPDISAPILEKVSQYMYYKTQYSDSTSRLPEFAIEPEIAMELLMAANYLDYPAAILRRTLQLMLLARQRRRARLVLQQAICFQAWFGFLFYPILSLLLREKLVARQYSSSLSRALPVCCLAVLIPADVARYYLGTRGNLRSQVFPLTAFMFLSACPLLPGLVYLSFFAEHRLPFDVAAGIIFVLLLAAETLAGLVVLRELLRQEAARFLRMREFSDTNKDDDERTRFLYGEDRDSKARSWQ